MNKLKELIKSTNLNYKKEMTFNIAMNACLIAGAVFLFIFSKNLMYLWPCILLIIIFNLGVLYRYTIIKCKNEEEEIKDIKTIISYTFLNLNRGETVEYSFNNLKSRVSLRSIEIINTFLAKTKKNNDLIYYLDFAKKYSSLDLVNLMSAIYKYSHEDKKENLLEINQIILEIEKTINSRKNFSNKFELIKTSPILGAFIAVLIFILSIVLITGNYIHG